MSFTNESLAGSGVALGIGGTNARYGVCEAGDIRDVFMIETPQTPEDFFSWMGHRILKAADDGHGWVVAGFPGPVSPDGTIIGPITNVEALRNEYNLTEELVAADPAVGELLEADFTLVAVNDGELAAHAAASRVGNYEYDKVAALIIGTGVGAGVVIRDGDDSGVYRADRNPYEIGHIPTSHNPFSTFENAISGPALERRYNGDPRQFPSPSKVWHEVGRTTARLALTLGLISGVELVVPTGGVGAGAAEKYWPELEKQVDAYVDLQVGQQAKFLPEIKPVAKGEADVFELFGAEGVVREYDANLEASEI